MRGSRKNPNSHSSDLRNSLLQFDAITLDSHQHGNCEEDVLTVCGIYLLAEEAKRVKRKYWICTVFRASVEEGEFHILFCTYER
jgi:hypothetical protein